MSKGFAFLTYHDLKDNNLVVVTMSGQNLGHLVPLIILLCMVFMKHIGQQRQIYSSMHLEDFSLHTFNAILGTLVEWMTLSSQKTLTQLEDIL